MPMENKKSNVIEGKFPQHASNEMNLSQLEELKESPVESAFSGEQKHPFDENLGISDNVVRIEDFNSKKGGVRGKSSSKKETNKMDKGNNAAPDISASAKKDKTNDMNLGMSPKAPPKDIMKLGA